MNLIELAINRKWEMSDRKLIDGDVIRILDKSSIFFGSDLTNGKEYTVRVHLGSAHIVDDIGDIFTMTHADSPYYELSVIEAQQGDVL